MKTKLDPAYKSIEEHIRQAQLERSIHIAEAISSGIVAISRGISVAMSHVAKGWTSHVRGRRLTAKRALAPR
jgi:hypothetical protein